MSDLLYIALWHNRSAKQVLPFLPTGSNNFFLQLIKELRRMHNLPSVNHLLLNAKKFFLKIINFAQSKNHKSGGLIEALKLLPLVLDDEEFTAGKF